MNERKEFVVPVIKTGLIAAATVFTALALLGGGDSSAAQSSSRSAEPDRAHSQVGSDAAGARFIVKNARVGTPVRVMHEINADFAGDQDVELDAASPRRRPAVKSGDGDNTQHGGVAGGGCPGEGDCLTAHGGLGCDDEECCDAVCKADAFCCLIAWEQSCVDIALGIETCLPPPPDCTEFAAPNAIYSNWHTDCWQFGYVPAAPPVPGPTSVIADDLWWGENGGVLQEFTFAVYNGTANTSNLQAATVEILFSTTTPGNQAGTLDLSTVFATFEVELTDLDLAPGFGLIVTIEPEGEVVLPTWGIYAGTRYLDATFDDEFSSMNTLGYVRPWPVAVGDSNRGFFREYAGQAQTFASGPGNFVWEIVVAEPDPGPTRILFDNAPQQLVISATTGNPTNGGFTTGVNTAGNMLWVTMPFTLGPLPEGGDAWRVTDFLVHAFVPGDSIPNIQTLGWAVWHRNGDAAPGDMIAQGTIDYPWLHQSHPLHNRPAGVHMIPVDVVLEPGEYFLTAHGGGAVAPAAIAWFTNAANGVKMVDANGPFYWRVTNYPGAWAKVGTTFLPHPEQPDPETLTVGTFAVLGEVADKTPTLTGACNISNCPADLTDSGTVGVADLLALLACWGPVAPGCEGADLTDSGTVGVADLLALLAAWGPCPAPDCQVLSADGCASAGGAYQGDGTSCP